MFLEAGNETTCTFKIAENRQRKISFLKTRIVPDAILNWIFEVCILANQPNRIQDGVYVHVDLILLYYSKEENQSHNSMNFIQLQSDFEHSG